MIDKQTRANIELPYNIGDIVYIVRDHISHHDKDGYYETSVGAKLTIEEHKVEALVIDSDGVHLAYESWDGILRYGDYERITVKINRCGFDKTIKAKIFTNHHDAVSYIRSLT